MGGRGGNASAAGNLTFGSDGYEIVGTISNTRTPYGWDWVGVDASVTNTTGHVNPNLNGPFAELKIGPISFTLTSEVVDGNRVYTFSGQAFGVGSYINVTYDQGTDLLVLDDGWIYDPNLSFGLGAEVAGHGLAYEAEVHHVDGAIVVIEHGIAGRGHFVSEGVYTRNIGEVATNSLDAAINAAHPFYEDAIVRMAGGGSGGGSGGSESSNDDSDTGSGAGAAGGGVTDPGQIAGDAGITTGTFTPPGEWSGPSQDHGTPGPGLPINPDYTGIQPIILDLDGDGVEVNAAANVDFDWDGDGFLESGSWTERNRRERPGMGEMAA